MYEVKELGIFPPQNDPNGFLEAGDVGYIIANMKSAADVKIERVTYTDYMRPCRPARFQRKSAPWSFPAFIRWIPPIFEALKAAMAKLQINDAAFSFQAESSVALGFGFRCGFLGRSICVIQEHCAELTWISSPPTPP